MPNHTPSPSRSTFIESLDNHPSPKPSRCLLCHGELNTIHPLDPAFLCQGPAIQLPCCNLLFGKHCLLEYMSHRSTPKCILCPELWYHEPPILAPRRKVWRNRWERCVVSGSCILYLVLVLHSVTIVEEREVISISSILDMLWRVWRPAIEVAVVVLLCAPINEGLQRRLLRRREGIVFYVVEAYIELPLLFSVPVMVVLQILVLGHLWGTVFGLLKGRRDG